MEPRRMMAVTASFTSSISLLTVTGDGVDNSITVSRTAAGSILVNGGAVPISGGVPTVANTALIQIFGSAGADALTLDESGGALPAAQIQGGTGNDTITGGSGNDNLFGEDGDDQLLGKGGVDTLNGGNDNDSLTGGDGDDQILGESGNDRMIWNPGDDTDLNEGGNGVDLTEINGGNGAEVFTVTANGARVRVDRINPAPFFIDVGTTENLLLHANAGDDSFSATGNLAALIQISVDGGTGLDTLFGSNGNDTLAGGDGADFIDGNQGNDTALLGAGDDTFGWDPGDGNDIVEGQAGTDRLLFNGSAASEIYEMSPNGQRLRFTRNVANIVLDLDGIERTDLNMLGGVDAVTVNHMAGTALVEMNINLAGTIGGSTGDAATDNVILNGSNGADTINVVGAGTSASITGLAVSVNVTNSEGANDSLVVNSLAGDDGVTATTLPAGVIKLVVDGGANDDLLLGSQDADVLRGGDGDDFIFGDNGSDTAFMGAGNDVFQWNPGDGNDVVEGQDGADTLLFFGANVNENVNISANGGRVLFFRDIANVAMDMNDTEAIDFRALGGADSIVIGDMTGTDLTRVDLDLRGPAGGGDGAADNVTVNGTLAADAFGAAGDAGGVNVYGLHTAVNLFSPEAANDRLTLNGQGEADAIDATTLADGAIALTFNGGLGADIIRGSAGNDLITGGDGNDTALMGAGDDSFVWNPGDDNDVLEGQAGIDTMQFNGANVAENISMSANGGRLLFTRDIASVVMDADGVERVNFNALGGADNITVNSLTPTDVSEVNIDLGAAGGAADAAVDTVQINGGAAFDLMDISGNAADGVTVAGMSATINVLHHEPANDRFTFRGLGGSDFINFNTLSGIDGTSMTVDYEGAVGAGNPDGSADQVTVNSDANGNSIGVSDVGAATFVTGISPALTLVHAEAGNDALRINSNLGADTITINQNGSAGAVRKVIVDAGDSQDLISIVNTAADGVVNILPSDGDDSVTVNNDGLFSANATFVGTQRIGSLDIGPNGFAMLSSGSNNVLTTAALGISSNGRLDLTNGAMIVDYSTISPIATIGSLLTTGFNNGAWNGIGINSSAAATQANRTLGYAEATDLFSVFPATFAGQSINPTCVLVRFTLPGDADLNRSVNISDFSRVASNFNLAGTRWTRGNFNYDGSTSISDFSVLASNFNTSIPGDLPRIGGGIFGEERVV